jgi:hypothetical protein
VGFFLAHTCLWVRGKRWRECNLGNIDMWRRQSGRLDLFLFFTAEPWSCSSQKIHIEADVTPKGKDDMGFSDA